MWEVMDYDLECGDECSGPGPPPEFLIPPPPRPPFLQELMDCSEEQFPEADMCAAIPVRLIIVNFSIIFFIDLGVFSDYLDLFFLCILITLGVL